MSERNCQNGCPGRFSAPGPLYDRVDSGIGSMPGKTRPTAVPSPPIRATERADLTHTRMHRYVNPVPLPSSAVEAESVCLLRQQTALLTDLLCAVNALTAVRLEQICKQAACCQKNRSEP